MAMTLVDIRAKFPDAYKDVPDQQLADAIYAKFYPTADRREFDARIGLRPYQNTAEAVGTAVQNAPTNMALSASGLQQMGAEAVTDMITPPRLDPGVQPAIGADGQPLPVVDNNPVGPLLRTILTPKGTEALGEAAAMESLKAQLAQQEQRGTLKPIDVSAGSLDYYLSGAIGSTAEMIPALVASIITKNPTPGVAVIMGQSAGQSYGEGRLEGLDPGRAREYAGLMSAAEAIPSYLPLGQFLSTGGNVLVGLGKGALTEAFQEGLTQALQIGIDQGYLSPDMTMGEALDQIKDAAIMGAIAGTMMDAGVKGADAATGKLYEGIYTANEAGKAAIQKLFPRTEQVAPPAKTGPTMLDRVNQALQRKGFAPIVPLPTEPEIAITGAAPAERVPGIEYNSAGKPVDPDTGYVMDPSDPRLQAQPVTTAAPVTPTSDGAATTATTGAAPTAPAAGGPVSAVDQIITIESGGNPTAQNPNGSAGGLGGFIDSTWIATVRNNAPELAGESDAQILARKKDATPEGIAFQRRMVEAHIGENAASLQANGIEPTPGNIYAAHFLGAGGANTVLKADDGAALAPLVGDAVMQANPFLKGMTVADFKAWTDKKMGGAGVSAITPGGAATMEATPMVGAEASMVTPPIIPAVESGDFNTAPAEVQRVGGLPPDAQAEADLIATSQQQRAVVDAGQGVLAPPATTQAAPAPVATAADLANVAADVNPDPTPAQIEAGNYRKAHIDLNGFKISIENPRGSIRRGVDTDGEAWEVTMPADYGYIKRTTGADGEQVDVYIGQSPESQAVFVVDQVDPDTNAFDEHKVIMGAASQAEAELIYKSAFSDKSGASRMGNITQMTADEFKGWLANGNPSNPVKKRLPPKHPRLTAEEGTLVVRSKDYAKVFGKTSDLKNKFYAHPESPVAQDRAQGWADAKAGLPPQQKPSKNGPDIRMDGLNPINAYLQGYIGGRWGDAFDVRAFDAPGVYRSIVNGTFDKDPEPKAPKPTDAAVMTVTAPGGMKIEVRPEVVAIDSLKPATGDLQPRDRSRAASDAQIEDIAINLDAERLMPSKEADRGAPIVGPDDVVESGNGRATAIRRAREAYPAKYAAYLEAVRAAGYAIEDGQMLVSRRVTELTAAERVAFVTAANTSAIARMSATEQALVDGKLIDASVLDTLQPGVPPMAPGSKFAQAFLGKLPQAERAALADRNGVLNADGVRRIQNALLAAAYGDAQTVAKSAENVDDNARSITGAMTDVAPEWLGMRRDIEAAGVSADYDMTESLMGALKLLDTARTKAAQQSRPVKALINEAVDQIDMLSGAVDPVTIEMVRAFYSEGFGRAKSRADIAAFLASITTEVQSAIQPQLLGAAPTPGEVIHGARRRSEKQAEQQGDIFASRAPRGRSTARRETDGERDVPSASAQDQQRAGAAPVAGREPARVGELSGSAEQAAGQRSESRAQDRSGTAADRGETDAELDALGVDNPMPGYVPMYLKKGVPDRPTNDRIRIGNREFELPPLDRPQRREGIRVQVEGIIGPRLYVGKIKGQSMLGFYRKSNSEVRTKAYDDIEVMAHEMAHYLDFHYTQAGKFTASYKGRKDVRDLSYTSAPRAVQKEGFAEFVRLWLTQYDEAVRAAPGYVAEFEKVLASDPALDRQMHKLQEHMHKWFLQGPHAQLRAKSGEEYTPTEQWMQFVQSYPLERARQNIIDNIHAAKVVERVTTGDIGDATKSAYKQFQMANGAESTYSAVVEFGTPVLDVDGSLQFGGESLMQVFWPVAKHGWKRFDLLMDYFKARRGKELLGQGREKLFTPQEIKAGLKLGVEYPEFAGVFGAYQKFNQRMLDWYVSMDLITKEQREAFGEANKSYVPFHRITKMIAEGGAAAGSGIGQRLAGGTANTRDIAVNIVEGLYSNVRGAMVARAKSTMYKQIMASQDGAMFAVKIAPDSKKVTAMLGDQARKVAQVMSELGIGISSNGFIVNEPAVDNAVYDVNEIAEVLQQRPELLDFWLVNQPPKTDGDTYVDSAIIDGEKVYFEVREPLLVDMLTGMGGTQIGAVLGTFMKIKTWQTRAVTSMPQFMIPNLVRDTLSAMALSKNNFKPVVTSLRGMWDFATSSKDYREFMLNGGGYGNSVQANTAESRVRRQLDLPAQTNWDRAAKMLARWDKINSAFEYGTRVGDYRLGRKAGRTPMEAAWQAREISTDFSKIGRADIWAAFLRTVPFANAGIQGLDKTARELAENKGKMTLGNLVKMNENKAKFLLRGSILTALTVTLWLLNNDDERYKALTDDERSRFWWIYLPGTAAPLKIPRPYDIGYIFASIPELMLNYSKNRDGKAAASQMGWILVNSSPVGEWPGLLQPIMEAQANKDWRGAAIVPEYMASREPRYQYNERTPMAYRKLGELLNISPLMAEHYASGYGRYIEQVAADLTEAFAWNKEAWGERPFTRSPLDYATFQFTGRAVPFRTKWTDGYYELKRRAEGAQSAFSALKAEALHNKQPLEGFLSNETNTALVAINRMFGRMDRQLATGADMVMAITYDPTLTRAQKEAQINAWYAQKNEAMAGMFEQVDTMLKDIAAP